MTEAFTREDEALRALFEVAPDPADGGFAARVVGRIEARTRRRRVVIALAAGAGAAVAAWPLGQLLVQVSTGLGSVVVDLAGTEWVADYAPVFAGAALAFLTPVVAALLEE